MTVLSWVNLYIKIVKFLFLLSIHIFTQIMTFIKASDSHNLTVTRLLHKNTCPLVKYSQTTA